MKIDKEINGCRFRTKTAANKDRKRKTKDNSVDIGVSKPSERTISSWYKLISCRVGENN
jgi:hypothetical protein